MRESRSRPNKVSNYIGSIIANAVALVVLNLLPSWNVIVLTDSYPDILWAVNMSLIVQIAGCFFLIFLHPLFLHHLAHAVFAVTSVIAGGVIYTVFPVDFARIPVDSGSLAWLNTIFRIVVIIGIVGAAISIVVHTVKAIRYLLRPEY